MAHYPDQQAGSVHVKVYDYGQVQLNIGHATGIGLRVADLHDLRYCIDRVLAQLPADRKDG